MNVNLEDIGLTKEALQQRVISEIANRLAYSDDGSETELTSQVAQAYRQQIIDGVKSVAETAVAPKVQDILEHTTFQETNVWGESKQPVRTLREFLIKRAEEWLTEKVNYNGKSQAEESYNWSPSQTRVAHMVHEHLQYEIECSVKAALADINSKIAIGIQETVKLKLKETLDALKVNIDVRK